MRSNGSDFERELELLVRARYPIIYVVTGEEIRLQEVIRSIAQRRGKRVLEWSCHSGLIPDGTPPESGKARDSATLDPLAALDLAMEFMDPAIFVFKDLHPFLSRGNPQVVRRLKDLAHHLRNSAKTLLLVSPVLEMPVELEKEITVLNFPLPTLADLDDQLSRIVEEVRHVKSVRIDLTPEDRTRLLQAALGLTLGEAENVFARILVKSERLTGEDVDEVFAEKQQIIRKSGLLEYYAAEEGFEALGGLPVLKDWLLKRARGFTQAARSFGLPPPRGILLLGVQGCGKSLCAKTVARQWRLPLLRFDMGRVFGSYVGSSEENSRRAIAVAESVAPAVLWIDEIDKAFAGSRGSGATDGGTTARVFGTFLTWLSEKSAPLVVVATANDISDLPPELLRKGRFDEIFFVDLPTAEERREIFQIQLRRRGRDDAAFDLDALIEASREFSGAEIEQSIIGGMFDAFASGEELTTAHVLRELQEAVPLARTMSEQIEQLRRWAAGRARNAGVGHVGISNATPASRDDSGLHCESRPD